MSDPAPTPEQIAAYAAAVRARLTGPGGAFELVDEDVRGVRLPVFAHRGRALIDLVANAADEYGDREYLIDGADGSVRVTYAQHRDAVASLAEAMRDDFGVAPGDRVMILAGNCANWVVTFWAVVAAGGVAVAGNAWWTPREAQYAIAHSGTSLVVADARRTALVPDGTRVLDIDADISRLMSAHRGAALRPVPVDEDEPAVIMYTSGTTGHPKGATHSHRNLLCVVQYHRMNDALAAEIGAPQAQPRRFLMSLPLFHIASLHNLAVPRLVSGDTVVIDNGRFDLDRVLALIERERVTNWAIVPTMAHRLVSHPGLERFDLSSLTAVSVNSAPSSPALKDRLRAAVPSVQQSVIDSYGLTESSTAATVASPLDLAAHPTTVGRAIAGVEVQIRDAGGAQLADGEEGEIWLRSMFVMLGYWNDPEATAAAITPDGWLRTGDIGTMRDGLLYMSTRRTDLILRGGENVYPAEVEAVLDEHPDVAECAVFGVDSPDLGQEVAAVVVSRRPLDETVLRDFLAERLAYFKVPSRWRITDEPLQRTATGKVVRTKLSAG